MISGQVREERLRIESGPRVRIASGGCVFTVPPEAIHRVLHTGGPRAVTIHAYSPPLIRTGAYRKGPGGELERESLPIEEELRASTALS